MPVTALKRVASLILLSTLSGCNFGTLSFTEKPPAETQVDKAILPQSIVLSGPSQSEVGICTPFEVIARDSRGNETRAAVDEPITLSTSLPSIELFRDIRCSEPTTRVQLLKGRSRAAFYLRSLANAPFAASALSSKLGLSSVFLASFQSPRSLVFLLSPSDMDGGYCGSEIRVGVRDAVGSPVNFTGELAISGLGGGAAFATNDCSGPALSSLVFTDTAQRSFFLKNDQIQAMTPTLTPALALATLKTPVTASMQNKAAPFSLVLDRAPTGLKLAEYSAMAARVQVRDSANNLINPAVPLAVNVSVTVGTGELSVAGTGVGTQALDLSLNAAAGSASFYIKPNQEPAVTYRATATFRGKALTEAVTLPVSMVAKAVKITAGPPEAETNTLAVGSGACSAALSVSLRDGLDRRFAPPAATAAPVLSDASSTLDFFHDSRCSIPVSVANPIVLAANALAENFFVRERDEAVTSRTLRVTAAGFSSAAPQFSLAISRKPFEVDPAFGNGGTHSFSLDNGIDVVSALTQAGSGGSYLVVGRSRIVGGQFRVGVAMLTANGDLDSNFNNKTGKLTSSGPISAPCAEARGNAVAAVGSGFFFVAGKCDSDFLLERISNNGAIVHSERASFGAMTEAQPFALAVSPSTDIYAVGTVFGGGVREIAVARYKSTGVLDASSQIGIGALGTLEEVRGAIVQRVGPDDKLVVLATIRDASGNADMALCRLVDSPTPALDPSFGVSGCQIFVAATEDSASALMALPNGKLLGVGTAAGVSTSSFLMVRTDAEGIPDSSFGSGGKALHVFADIQATTASLFPDASGQFLVAGLRKGLIPGQSSWYAARFGSNGALDSTQIVNTKTFILTSPGSIGGVFIGTDNKPVIAGTVGNRQSVTQVLH